MKYHSLPRLMIFSLVPAMIYLIIFPAVVGAALRFTFLPFALTTYAAPTIGGFGLTGGSVVVRNWLII